MKYRYLIEHGVPDLTVVDGELVELTLCLTVITPDDDTGKTNYERFVDVEAAQARAVEYERNLNPEVTLKWKPAPEAWQPDALLVSQYLDDGVEPNRDA